MARVVPARVEGLSGSVCSSAREQRRRWFEMRPVPPVIFERLVRSYPQFTFRSLFAVSPPRQMTPDVASFRG